MDIVIKINGCEFTLTNYNCRGCNILDTGYVNQDKKELHLKLSDKLKNEKLKNLIELLYITETQSVKDLIIRDFLEGSEFLNV